MSQENVASAEPSRIELDIGKAMEMLEKNPDVAKRMNELVFGKLAAEEIDNLYKEVARLKTILHKLMNNPHANLDAIAYSIRDSEGKGWDGPSVVAWGEAVAAAQKELDDFLG